MKAYSVVIPTLGNRPESLRRLLWDLRSQSELPNRVIVVTAPGAALFDPRDELTGIPSLLLECDQASAAKQRNLGAAKVVTPIIVFLDDDVRIGENVIPSLIEALEYRKASGVAGRMEEGGEHPKPGFITRFYYRLQSGYAHPHFGSRVLGPAITTFPCYEWEPDDLIESDWLNSACVVYDRELFEEVGGFPPFKGYSPFEDVHLSMRMAEKRKLYFHRGILYQHLVEEDGIVGGDQSFAIGRMFIRNQRQTARELLSLSPVALEAKLTLHKFWILLSLLRRRPSGWTGRALGTLFS